MSDLHTVCGRKRENKSFKVHNQDPREVLDAVSNNITGSVKPVDIDDNVYLQLIFDAASGYMQGLQLREKRDAGREVLRGIKRLELAVGKTVKRYHTDNENNSIQRS